MKIKEVWTENEIIDVLNCAEFSAKSGWDMDFISDMQERFSEYGMEMMISDNQERHLRRLAGC